MARKKKTTKNSIILTFSMLEALRDRADRLINSDMDGQWPLDDNKQIIILEQTTGEPEVSFQVQAAYTGTHIEKDVLEYDGD